MLLHARNEKQWASVAPLQNCQISTKREKILRKRSKSKRNFCFLILVPVKGRVNFVVGRLLVFVMIIAQAGCCHNTLLVECKQNKCELE
jgi:hypothetical protein